MRRLIYSAIVSLDGYHVDRDGGFAWAEPGDEAFAFITGAGEAGRHPSLRSPCLRDDGRLGDRPDAGPAVAADARFRRDLAGGREDRLLEDADLAAHALRAGLVDEIQVYLAPCVVGGGAPYLPADVAIGLELTDHLRFPDGMVHLRYDVRG